MPYRAIVLAEETWISARALGAWLDAGQEVTEVWIAPGSSLRRPVRQPLAIAFPSWSARRIIRRRGLAVRHCPLLRHWPEAPSRAVDAGADVLLNLLGFQIIPPALLARFAGRALNVHPALLPRYRGPCPRLAMIVDGRTGAAGGVCLHLLTDGIDEGPIVAERPVPFPDVGGYAEWDAALADAAADLIATAALAYLDGRRSPTPQDESLATYRRALPGELDIGPTTSLDHARRLVATLGGVGKLQCRPAAGGSSRKAYHVTGIARVIGGPTGRPPRAGWRTVELDLADARVVLRRRGLRDRLRGRMEAYAALSRRRRATGARP